MKRGQIVSGTDAATIGGMARKRDKEFQVFQVFKAAIQRVSKRLTAQALALVRQEPDLQFFAILMGDRLPRQSQAPNWRSA